MSSQVVIPASGNLSFEDGLQTSGNDREGYNDVLLVMNLVVALFAVLLLSI